MTDLSQVFTSAIAQWILGQKSLGQALQEALAEYVANLAAKASPLTVRGAFTLALL